MTRELSKKKIILYILRGSVSVLEGNGCQPVLTATPAIWIGKIDIGQVCEKETWDSPARDREAKTMNHFNIYENS